jgi:hypothetical protein
VDDGGAGRFIVAGAVVFALLLRQQRTRKQYDSNK